MIKFDQYSVAMNLKVEADSSVFIGEDEKFTAILFLGPILKEENTSPKKVKIIKPKIKSS